MSRHPPSIFTWAKGIQGIQAANEIYQPLIQYSKAGSIVIRNGYIFDTLFMDVGRKTRTNHHAVVDQFLATGYSVRGTVSDTKKSAWLKPLAWDTAGAGAAGLSVQDIGKALEEELPRKEALLQAARSESSVRLFIYTSSAWEVIERLNPTRSKRQVLKDTEPTRSIIEEQGQVLAEGEEKLEQLEQEIPEDIGNLMKQNDEVVVTQVRKADAEQEKGHDRTDTDEPRTDEPNASKATKR
ncbi:hypothetical protein F5Y04DRAFT_280375 [Hypomontagnella monticulosa]|nr:hypothetical protein F5Y04DRAFT_280375 [Hypomontagnella monticulosa]